MAPTMTYTGTLVVTSCWCGIKMAIPEDLYDYARRRGETVYCPLGHKFIYGDTVTEKLKQAEAALTKERNRRQATADLLAHEERSHAATKGHLTRKRSQLKRVHAGVCPHCNRTFRDLARHMAGQHSEHATGGE